MRFHLKEVHNLLNIEYVQKVLHCDVCGVNLISCVDMFCRSFCLVKFSTVYLKFSTVYTD